MGASSYALAVANASRLEKPEPEILSEEWDGTKCTIHYIAPPPWRDYWRALPSHPHERRG